MVEDRSIDSPLTTEPLYADVIVPRHLAGPFTYAVPIQLKPMLHVGQLVLVPFGRAHLQGAVVALTRRLPKGMDRTRLKEIRSMTMDSGAAKVPESLLGLAQRVANDYVAPWGQCLRLVWLPRSTGRAGAIRYRLTAQGREVLAAGLTESGEARLFLERLSNKPAGIKRSTLLDRTGSRHGVLLDRLVADGWIEESDRPASTAKDRASFTTAEREGDNRNRTELPARVPNDPVSAEWETRLVEAIKNHQPTRLFLQGPLMGRLAWLHRAVCEVCDQKRTALVLVGEAERAAWMTETLGRAGINSIACFHAGLPGDQKIDIWERVHRRDLQVVVGTRSAVFLPLPSLGLLWVEHEEDPSLKEPQEPRYHARDVAWIRACEEQALLVQSSSHLSLDSFTAARAQEGGSSGLFLVAPRPQIEIVDLRGQDHRMLLSPPMVAATRAAIERQTGALLFLNRKGYAGALLCRDCGEVLRCRSCRVALTYSRQGARLSCSYCGSAVATPNTCASCSGSRLHPIGEGTERLEDEVRRQFPEARIIRADGDTMRQPAQAASIWKRIKNRDWDVLIGTQVALRDYLIPPVELVGVVQADAGLSLPDFRAAERTYHLLLDAVGLARSSADGGRAIIQSYLPSHHAIRAVVQGDESIFQTEELSHRTTLGYPPAVHVIVLYVSGKKEQLVHEAAASWAKALKACDHGSLARRRAPAQDDRRQSSEGLVVLGPVPPPVPTLRGRYRQQILVKAPQREAGIQAVRETVGRLEQAYPTRAVKFAVDVDPVEMW
jgi:primosomal protein N' (replication factor Y)